jgi:hypothetical protein
VGEMTNAYTILYGLSVGSDNFVNLDVDSVMLKWIFKKEIVRLSTGLIFTT